jgi:hypothetical protein
MRLWPFRRKKRLKQAEEAVNHFAKLLQFKQQQCDPLLASSKLCVCVDCPKRGKCSLEKISRHTGCQRFIRACSAKPLVKSKTAEIILEEYYDMLQKKYLHGGF